MTHNQPDPCEDCGRAHLPMLWGCPYGISGAHAGTHMFVREELDLAA